MNALTAYRLVYLATPYTRYPEGIEAAFREACRIAAGLLRHGVRVYSPIAHTHPIAIHGGIDPCDLGVWLPFDEAMMEACEALCVAEMLGWTESVGVRHEINTFGARGKRICFVNPVSLGIREPEWNTD